MSSITWVTCGHCDGAGTVTGLLDEPYTCGECGGHQVRPADDCQGVAWFYRPRGEWGQERIAVLMRDLEHPDRWRVTFYDKSGPASHWVERADRIMNELRGFRQAAGAARLLDDWSRRPEWARGMQAATLNAYYSLFSFSGRLDLAQEINSIAYSVSFQAAIRRGEALRRAHLPGVAVFG